MLKLAGVAAIPLSIFGLYEGLKGDLASENTAATVDPYAAIRGQVATANAHLNSMGQTISSDQFASQIAGATPKFGSLAAPVFNTASSVAGVGAGHF